MSGQEVEIREALRQAIDEEMERDINVFVMGEEVAEYNGAYKVTKGLWEKYGTDRIKDTPITEAGFSGMGIGAALAGLRPIVEFMSFNFSFVAFDQIVNNAFKMYYMSAGRFRVPIVFRGPNGAAAQVSCQHSHNVESLFAYFPGCKVVAPSTAYHSKGLLKAAIRCDDPVIFLENEMIYGLREKIPTEEYLLEFGKAHVVQEGKHVTLVGYSRMMSYCREAADAMRKKGYEVELIDLVSIKPLDIGTILTSVRKTHRVVLVEEGHLFGGVCAELGMLIMQLGFDYLDAPVERVCQKETPLPYSPVLEAETIPNVRRIIRALETVLEGM